MDPLNFRVLKKIPSYLKSLSLFIWFFRLSHCNLQIDLPHKPQIWCYDILIRCIPSVCLLVRLSVRVPVRPRITSFLKVFAAKNPNMVYRIHWVKVFRTLTERFSEFNAGIYPGLLKYSRMTRVSLHITRCETLFWINYFLVKIWNIANKHCKGVYWSRLRVFWRIIFVCSLHW